MLKTLQGMNNLIIRTKASLYSFSNRLLTADLQRRGLTSRLHGLRIHVDKKPN